MLARERLQCVAQRDEKTGQPFDVETVEIGGQDARCDDTILKSKTRSRKPLRVVGEDAPLTVRAAGETSAVHVKENAAGRGHTMAWQ